MVLLQLTHSESLERPSLAMDAVEAAEETPDEKGGEVPATPKKEPEEDECLVKKRPASKAPKAKASPKAHGSPGKPPPTPKAKAKTKAKAKAKAKPAPKEKAKPSKTTNSKNTGTNSGAPKKRPAGKKDEKQETKKAKTGASASAWGVPLGQEVKAEEEEEEEVLEEDPVDEKEFALPKKETETKETKDRSKNNKKLLESKQLPSWLVEAWNATMKMGPGKLERQRSIVNEAFDHSEGKLVLNTSKPLFEEMRQTYTKTESKSSQRSLPKTLFMGQFNLSEALFEAGLQNGDFQEVVDKSGKKKYAWVEDEHVETKGKSATSMQKDSRDGKAEDKALFQKSARDWRIGLFEETGSRPAPSSSGLLSLEDQKRSLSEKQWNAAQEMLCKAGGAMGRFLASGDKLLQQVGVDNKESELWGKLCLVSIL